MKSLQLFTLTLIIVCHMHCGSHTTTSAGLHLNMGETAKFNPNASHGKIEKFRLRVTGSDLPQQIEQIYPYGTESATIEGLPPDSDVIVTLEAINVNDIPVRRGESQNIKIISGTNTTAELNLNNIPIFSNVRNGAIVYNNRFAPKIFAPGEINFQLSQQVGSESTLMEDIIENSTNFSIGKDITSSVMTVHTGELELGSHKLTVRDPDTEEASTIEIKVLDGKHKKGLATTAGAHLGSPIGLQSNFILQQQVMTNIE